MATVCYLPATEQVTQDADVCPPLISRVTLDKLSLISLGFILSNTPISFCANEKIVPT